MGKNRTRQNYPANGEHFTQVALEEWANVPEDEINNSRERMPCPIEAQWKGW